MKHSAAIFLILMASYLFVFHGIPISGDERALFAATQSLVRYGDTQLYSVYNQYTGDPWSGALHEPLSIALAVPIYWLAQQTAFIGMLQAVWFLNVLFTALIGPVIYLTGRELNYNPRTSFITALVVGLATMLMPYSQTYFREPLSALWVALIALLAFKLNNKFRWWVAFALFVACLSALLTKTALVLLFPALLLVLFRQDWRFNATVVAVAVLLVGVVFLLAQTDRYDLSTYQGRSTSTTLDYIQTVFGAYLLSPGRSIWATSPVLLLAIPGAWLAYQQKQYRLLLAPVVFLFTLTAGYALGGWDWHGGLGWGARYLLPVIPLLGLLLLPIFERKWWRVSAVFIALSMVVQFMAVAVPTTRYYNYMDDELPGRDIAAYYDEGIWEIEYIPLTVHFDLYDWQAAPFAWRHGDQSGWALMVVVVWLLASAGLLWRGSKFILPVILILVTVGSVFALAIFYNDNRLQRDDINQLIAETTLRAGADDIILLANPSYQDVFLNRYRGEGVLATLPYLDTERYSPDDQPVEPPDVDNDGSIDANERVDGQTSRILRHLNGQYNRIWLVMNAGPYTPWALRPVEEWLSNFYYPVQSVEVSDRARLIEYYPQSAPVAVPPQNTQYHFQDSLTLSAFEVGHVSCGVVPVTLEWQGALDANIGIQLLREDGSVVSEAGGVLNHGFPPPRYFYLENYALIAPPGNYMLRVFLYNWQDLSRLPITANDALLDQTHIDLIPITIPAC